MSIIISMIKYFCFNKPSRKDIEQISIPVFSAEVVYFLTL
ncbi:hypothetical protein AR1Y2_1863 [Anaerostipes rhamnosivorans]|uniref:Uncharacterized protein n=1 Tax=Anaerostipes rhamnosivorans TaxID=1229621 RepID=A0A4P8IF75_9FIRM|nr:hypothetical protein AR1Y2_1863 [Anaerostipes rhamnosivorans]